jgi:methylmalonyl-CoA mutase
MENKKEVSVLFSEFPPVTREEWEAKITEELKGADYHKRLLWNTLEKFNVRPYYRQEDLTGNEYLDALPGEYPYVRGNEPNSNDWEIKQDILLENIDEANQKSLFVLDRGITSLGFICYPEKWDVLFKSQQDFSHLLKDIYFDCIGLHFTCGNCAPGVLQFLTEETIRKKIDPNHIRGSVDFDPLGYLTISGKFHNAESADFKRLEKIVSATSATFPNYKVIGINGYFFHNAAASVVQELGYSLAMAAEYLVRLTDAGLSVDTVCRHLQFNFGVGANYFMEIAKIRAARFLWTRIVEAFKPEKEVSKKAYIHSITSEWNQTIYDPYVNVLRATTESMAAVIGGTNSLAIRPFTYSFKPTTKFSGRIARNIQIILKEEAYLGKIVDPSAGSYYIENLTNSIIEEAWKLFLSVELEGGYLNSLKKGIIQQDIQSTAQNRDTLVATRREILLGTNQYPNPEEKVKDEVKENLAFPPDETGEFNVTPIRKYRGAMEFERLRLAAERHTKGQPKVFLFTIGNPVMQKARAAFSASFFACGGYKIIDNPGFKTTQEGIDAAIKANAEIVVICSSDEEYADIAPLVYGGLKNKSIIIVAGAPPCMEELKTKGVVNFIHVRSNLLETLREYHIQLGII